LNNYRIKGSTDSSTPQEMPFFWSELRNISPERGDKKGGIIGPVLELITV
jgi:hypothetical protein